MMQSAPIPAESAAAAPLSLEEARRRHIRRADMVACKLAFIDCKMPGSELKENYSLIGPGVTQSEDQVVNLTEPHGFSLGVAAMPPGTTNNLHIHFTAEVFMVHRGRWLFRWGADGQDGEIMGGPGDVVSVPTWIFRGFSNVGDEDGWIFTALGGDDTGGIIWHPSILDHAARHGLYLTKGNMLVDTASGVPKPAPEVLIEPIDPSAIAALKRYSAEDMRRRVVAAGERQWSRHALLDAVLPGHASELAPVLGHGMTQDRGQEATILNPHGFSIDWLRIPPGNQVGPFKLEHKQALILFQGALDVDLNKRGQEVRTRVADGEVFSIPAEVWRTLRCAGDKAVEIAVITAGEAKKRPVWADEIEAAAAAGGLAVDHSGYLAPRHLLPHLMQAPVSDGADRRMAAE